MHVLYLNSRIFVIPVYIFNGRKQTLVDTSGYCQHCACVVCMTSASSWPNCVSRVARIEPAKEIHVPCHTLRRWWTFVTDKCLSIYYLPVLILLSICLFLYSSCPMTSHCLRASSRISSLESSCLSLTMASWRRLSKLTSPRGNCRLCHGSLTRSSRYKTL